MFPLTNPDSEDVQSLVLFDLPAAALSSGLVRALMGLEGAGGLLSLSPRAGSSFWYYVRHMIFTPCRPMLTPNLHLLGINLGSLPLTITKGGTGRVTLLLLGRTNMMLKE